MNLLADPRTSLSEMMAIWEEVDSIEYRGMTTFADLCDRPREGYPCKVGMLGLQFEAVISCLQLHLCF